MQTLDIILGIFLLILFFNGLRKGIIKSVVGLIGLLATIYLIATYASTAKILIIEKWNAPEMVATILSYILIAIVVAIIFRIVIFILHRIVNILNLGVVDKLLGGILGVLSGAIIIAILLMICDISPFYKEIRKFTSNSVIVNYVRSTSGKIQKDYPKLKQTTKIDKTLKKNAENLKETLEDQINKPKELIEELIEEKTK